MDIRTSSAYLFSMFDRLVASLAIFAIAVVTTISAAHAAGVGMNPGPDHAAHVDATIHAPGCAEPACDDGMHDGSADAAMCEFVCAGLSVALMLPGVEAGLPFGPVSHEFPPAASHVGRAPALDERPPRLLLL